MQETRRRKRSCSSYFLQNRLVSGAQIEQVLSRVIRESEEGWKGE